MSVDLAYESRRGRVRTVVHRTAGVRKGPITRLMSPGDVGLLLKPFVFLDLFEMDQVAGRGFPPHPHSGIATLTAFLEGGATYVDTTGKSGTLTAGAVEWMNSGLGAWHSGRPTPGQAMRGYQLWLALPGELELAPAESLYLAPNQIRSVGPARVLLGDYEDMASPIRWPASLTFLHVRLAKSQRWTYAPGSGHEVAWLAINRGRLRLGNEVLERELAMFSEGDGEIEFSAEEDVEFVLGSGAKHPHHLVMGYYSVHTSEAALARGEAHIESLGKSSEVMAMGGR